MKTVETYNSSADCNAGLIEARSRQSIADGSRTGFNAACQVAIRLGLHEIFYRGQKAPAWISGQRFTLSR